MLKFGLQGLSGPSASTSEATIAAYCRVFLDRIGHKGTLLIARDLRPGGDRVCAALAAAAAEAGVLPVDCGPLPAPALALAAKTQRTSAILASSHALSEDQTGLRFFSATGEISRYDEARISAALTGIKHVAPRPVDAVPTDNQALTNYVVRNTAFHAGQPLKGFRIGVCQHSSTARKALIKTLTLLGADVGFDAAADAYLPFDPLNPDPLGLARVRRWQEREGLHAIVSASISGDYPFLLDNRGQQVPGDVMAPLCAADLGARALFVEGTVVSAAEALGGFERISRVEGGIAMVLTAMEKAISRGTQRVMGYDRRGGMILGFDLMRNATTLSRLMCADGLLPIVMLLVRTARAGSTDIAAQIASLDLPRTDTLVLKNFPWPRIAKIMRGIPERGPIDGWEALGQIVLRQEVSGLRIRFDTGLTVHFEPNAIGPDLQVHIEGPTQPAVAQARSLLESRLAPPDRCHDRSA